MGYVGTKPADAALTTSDLGDSIVTAAKLATDAVETAKVKDLNVTVAKLPATVDISSKTVTLPASKAVYLDASDDPVPDTLASKGFALAVAIAL